MPFLNVVLVLTLDEFGAHRTTSTARCAALVIAAGTGQFEVGIYEAGRGPAGVLPSPSPSERELVFAFIHVQDGHKTKITAKVTPKVFAQALDHFRSQSAFDYFDPSSGSYSTTSKFTTIPGLKLSVKISGAQSVSPVRPTTSIAAISSRLACRHAPPPFPPGWTQVWSSATPGTVPRPDP